MRLNKTLRRTLFLVVQFLVDGTLGGEGGFVVGAEGEHGGTASCSTLRPQDKQEQSPGAQPSRHVVVRPATTPRSLRSVANLMRFPQCRSNACAYRRTYALLRH